MNIKRDEQGVAHLVGISGGKDSVCVAIELQEREPRPYTFVCTPTGDELPEMIAHWERIEIVLGEPIQRITNGTLESVIRQMNALPNHMMRFCTRILKLKPFEELVGESLPCVTYIGLRADEDEREGMRPGRESGALRSQCIRRYPLQEWEWGIDEVYASLDRHGITIPERTDCGACFFQRLGEWYNLWLNHPDRYATYEGWESEFGHTFRSASRDTWPAALKDLRALFEEGKAPARSLKMMETRKGMCRACSL